MSKKEVLIFLLLGNYFLVVQMDETELNSGNTKTQKYRTEIDRNTEYPQFFKNYFEFFISTENKITLRVGLFNTEINSKNGNQTTSEIDANFLFSKSQLVASTQLTLATNLFNLLKEHKWIENNLRMKHPEKINLDSYSSHIFFRISLKFDKLQMKIFDHNSEIEKYSNDLFEKDERIVKEKLNHIIILNEERQFKLDKISNKLDDINSKLKFVLLDKKNIQNELSKAEQENTLLHKSISRLENYEEIHIDVELLSNSSQGISMLKKKLAILLSQKSFLNQNRLELEDEYTSIESILSKIKIIKEKIQATNVANRELQFNMKRQEDLVPLVSSYQNQINRNEEVIINLKQDISREKGANVIKKNNDNTREYLVSAGEISDEIILEYNERKRIEEKLMQMKLFTEIYDEDPQENVKEVFIRIMGGGLDAKLNKILFECEVEILNRLMDKIPLLKDEENRLLGYLSEIKSSENEFDEINMIELDIDNRLRRDELKMIAESLDVREKVLSDELEKSNLYYGETIRKLKERIENIDRFINGIQILKEK